MAVFISIVSHGHDKLIKELACIENLSDEFNIVVKSNKPNENFDYLNVRGNITWINNEYYKGFGENNNIVFKFCRDKLEMKNDDYFVVLNPDLIIDSKDISDLMNRMECQNVDIAAINLFKDNDNRVYDNSIRRFPNLFQFAKSFLGFSNNTIIDKSVINEKCTVDWAAGSFLAFRCEHYLELQGFDEGYFMYCEDVDICYRSNKKGKSVVYYPDLTAQHLAKHANRKLFSKHFYWHVSSVIRFILSKYALISNKSSI